MIGNLNTAIMHLLNNIYSIKISNKKDWITAPKNFNKINTSTDIVKLTKKCQNGLVSNALSKYLTNFKVSLVKNKL